MEIEKIRHWGKTILNGDWTKVEAEQCAEDILNEGKIEGLKEFLDFLENKMNWGNINEYHEITDNKMNELREIITKFTHKGHKTNKEVKNEN